MTVHNHGTEEGKGLACRESVVNGELKGECMTDDLRARIAAVLGANSHMSRELQDHLADAERQQWADDEGIPR